MSTSKLDTSGVFQPVMLKTNSTHLTLSSSDVRVRKNGIEFLSSKPLPAWAEMTVELQSPRDGKKIKATGVVVDCIGNRHTGYSVSMIFMNLSRQSQAHLSTLAYSELA
jgi:hypothetical protein